jgi:hypothetical protein
MNIDVARWVDRGVAFTVGLQKMYADGWGDPDVMSFLIERTTNFFEEPADIDIEWGEGRQRRDGLWVFQGRFESPDMSLPLPPESRTAYFQFLLPEDAFEGRLPPVCLHLAGSGDASYLGRMLQAKPLVQEEGIGALILQNPFYGERRPDDQTGTKLRRVTDQLAMNLATIEEARSLLRWLRDDGYLEVGVTGYSMGGYMAAMAAQMVSFRLAVVPCATANTAVAPMIHSPLSQLYDWSALERELRVHHSPQRLMAKLMRRFAISENGTLKYPELAIIVGTLRDEFIPPSGVVQLYRHWRGSQLRWIDAGHTTGWALHGGELRSALRDAFRQLRAARRSPARGTERRREVS